MKAPRIPKALQNAVRSNDPDQVLACLPPEPNPLKLIEALLTEADRVGVGLVGRCHQEITSHDPDVVGSLHRLGEQITNYLGVRAILNERIPYRFRTAEEILAVYSNPSSTVSKSRMLIINGLQKPVRAVALHFPAVAKLLPG